MPANQPPVRTLWHYSANGLSRSTLRGYRKAQRATETTADLFQLLIGAPDAEGDGNDWYNGADFDADSFQPFNGIFLSGPIGTLEQFLADLKALIESYALQPPPIDLSIPAQVDDDDEAEEPTPNHAAAAE